MESRSAVKDGEIPEEFSVLSCEEDYAICVPFLEKGSFFFLVGNLRFH